MKRIAVIGAAIVAVLALGAGPASARHGGTAGDGMQCFGLSTAGVESPTDSCPDS